MRRGGKQIAKIQLGHKFKNIHGNTWCHGNCDQRIYHHTNLIAVAGGIETRHVNQYLGFCGVRFAGRPEEIATSNKTGGSK